MRPIALASLATAAALAAGAAFAQPAARSCARVEVSSALPRGATAPAPAPSRSGTVSNTAVPDGAAPNAVDPSSPVPNVLVFPAPAFSATQILDLTFTVLFPPSLAGEHVVELRVFTPDSQLYRSLAVPFAPGAPPGAVRAVEGYARPLPQQALRQVSRGRSLFAAASTTLPVGGTDIVSSGLYGRWRVEAYLDGAGQRCGPAAVFTLNP